MDERRLEDAVDRVEIRAVLESYADIVSRRAWAELTEVMLADVVLDLDLREQSMVVTGPAGIGAFIAERIAGFEFFQFVILNTRVQLHSGGDRDRAASRMYMSELRQTFEGHWTQVYGVYHDRLRRVDGRWMLAHRTYHSLARNNVPAALYDFPHHLALDDL